MGKQFPGIGLFYTMLLLAVGTTGSCGGGDTSVGGTDGGVIDGGTAGAKQPTEMFLTSIQPKSGSSGDQIKLTGSGLFLDKIGSVHFGSQTALLINSDQGGFELTVQAPAQLFGFANPVQVSVDAKAGGTATFNGSFTYVDNVNCMKGAAQPLITLINQTNLNLNSEVHISGNNFSGDVKVNIAGQPSTLLAVSQTAIVALLPDNVAASCGATFPCSLEVAVANGNGCAGKDFVVVSKQGVPVENTLKSSLSNFGSDLLAMDDDIDGDGTNDFAVLSTTDIDVVASKTTQPMTSIWNEQINHLSACQAMATSLPLKNRLYATGDINKDNVNDLAIVGGMQGSTKRMICVVNGKNGASEDFISAAWTKVSNWGTVLQSAGDVDGDQKNDLIVSHSFYEDSTAVAGRLELYLGKTLLDGVSTNNTPFKTFVPPTGNMQGFGNALANLGDLNGDGFDEIAVAAYVQGAPGSFAGSVFIYSMQGLYSASTWTLPNYLQQITVDLSGEYFGIHLATIADLDGDGFKDLLVGARNSAVYVYSSKTLLTATMPQPLFKVTPSNMGLFAARIGDAGDVDGDGVNDIMISDTLAYGQRGAVQVYSGKPNASNNSVPLFARYGTTVDDNFGYSIATLGDINNDGVSEVLIGAPYISSLSSGEVLLTNMFGAGAVYPPFQY